MGVHALRRVRLLLRSARYPPDRRQLHRRWRLRYPHACLRSAVVRKITESDDIALGHFCTFGYMFTALIASITKKLAGGKESKSTEDLEIPQSLSFLQDTYAAVGLVMIVFYLSSLLSLVRCCC